MSPRRAASPVPSGVEQMKVGSMCTVLCACVSWLSPFSMASSMRHFTACSFSSERVSDSSARCTWGQRVRAGWQDRGDRGHHTLGTERQGQALPACRRGRCPGVQTGSSPGPCVEGGGVTQRAPGRAAAAWPEGPDPGRASPPPLRIPAAGGRGLGSVVARQRRAAVVTGQPGVEGTAVPHDDDGAEAVLEAGRCRRLLPPHHHAHAPARGRRLVSARAGDV